MADAYASSDQLRHGKVVGHVRVQYISVYVGVSALGRVSTRVGHAIWTLKQANVQPVRSSETRRTSHNAPRA